MSRSKTPGSEALSHTVNNLFLQWFTEAETEEYIMHVIDELRFSKEGGVSANYSLAHNPPSSAGVDPVNTSNPPDSLDRRDGHLSDSDSDEKTPTRESVATKRKGLGLQPLTVSDSNNGASVETAPGPYKINSPTCLSSSPEKYSIEVTHGNHHRPLRLSSSASSDDDWKSVSSSGSDDSPGRRASRERRLRKLSFESIGPGSPPRSPIRRPDGSGRRSMTPIRLSSRTTAESKRLERPSDRIKPFFFPHGAPPSPGTSMRSKGLIDQLFMPHAEESMNLEAFMSITTNVCELPSFCNSTLFERIDTEQVGVVTRGQFMAFWEKNLKRYSNLSQRLFHVLRQEQNKFLVRDDFRILISEVVNRHPGLTFLERTPEFQFRYVQTVIARIFYRVNRTGSEKLTMRELEKSNFLTTLSLLDEEDDINKINDYFSYEHFYVIYCKFWELDTDHDFLIDAQDLSRYQNFSLTPKIVERVFSGVARPLRSATPGQMNYEDFIVFFISEVDKNSPVSREYWFRCLDLDGDGVISLFELEPFFEEQIERLQFLSQDTILVEDLLCQMTDMIEPETEGQFTRKDLKGSKLTSYFFNMIFNMNKYATAEARDPFLAQQLHETPELRYVYLIVFCVCM